MLSGPLYRLMSISYLTMGSVCKNNPYIVKVYQLGHEPQCYTHFVIIGTHFLSGTHFLKTFLNQSTSYLGLSIMVVRGRQGAIFRKIGPILALWWPKNSEIWAQMELLGVAATKSSDLTLFFLRRFLTL